MEMMDEIYIERSGRATFSPQVYNQVTNKDALTKYYHSRIVEALKDELNKQTHENARLKDLNEQLKAEALGVHCDFILGGIGSLTEALKENEELKAELAKMQWQPIETAPKDGTEILLALWSGHPEHKTAFCWSINGYYKNGFFYSKDHTVGKLIPPTHWQPITAPEQR